MTSPPLTPAARRHVRTLLRAIAPVAQRLEQRFKRELRAGGYDAAQIRALAAITPAAAGRLRTLPRFLEQVEYNGRRLAKLNVPPEDVATVLRRFDEILEDSFPGAFEPAREQLQTAAIYVLNAAFYRVREAEAQTFFGLYRAETEARDLEDLLSRFVRILIQSFHARAGRLLLLETPLQGKLGRPLYIERGSRDERLVADDGMRGRCESYWSYPLGSEGLLQLGFPVPYRWLPREVVLLEAIAGHCCRAIERSRMAGEIRRLEAERRRAEQEERRRIGRELHDEAGQSLLLLRLQLEMMERSAPDGLRRQLEEARESVERTVAELRRIIAALSPSVLERLGLEAALRQLVARFQTLHPAQVRLRVSVGSTALSRQTEGVIYRVAQECLQNVAKHSRATTVKLLVNSADNNIRLSVSDNGAGFCAEATGIKPMSFGLAGMRERAALLGGTLAVRSAPGKGTTVALNLPRASAAVNDNGKNTIIANR